MSFENESGLIWGRAVLATRVSEEQHRTEPDTQCGKIGGRLRYGSRSNDRPGQPGATAGGDRTLGMGYEVGGSGQLHQLVDVGKAACLIRANDKRKNARQVRTVLLLAGSGNASNIIKGAKLRKALVFRTPRVCVRRIASDRKSVRGAVIVETKRPRKRPLAGPDLHARGRKIDGELDRVVGLEQQIHAAEVAASESRRTISLGECKSTI